MYIEVVWNLCTYILQKKNIITVQNTFKVTTFAPKYYLDGYQLCQKFSVSFKTISVKASLKFSLSIGCEGPFVPQNNNCTFPEPIPVHKVCVEFIYLHYSKERYQILEYVLFLICDGDELQ